MLNRQLSPSIFFILFMISPTLTAKLVHVEPDTFGNRFGMVAIELGKDGIL